MRKHLNILVVSRIKYDLTELEQLLGEQPGVVVSKRLISDGESDPLAGTKSRPDVLVLSLSDAWQHELQGLAANRSAARPPTIVVGPADNTQIMRQAMQAGVQDFFTRPVSEDELADAIKNLHKERQAATQAGKGQLTAVINAKGGSGASALSCNLAHAMAMVLDRRVALIDLDIQFGALPLYLDLHPEYDLTDVLEAGNNLDATALEGYMAKHQSGLHVLSAPSEKLLLTEEVSVKRVEKLMEVAEANYQQIIVDLPRQIDPLTGFILERANKIIVVVQQSVGHLRDAVRLLGVLNGDMGIAAEQIDIVLNRFDSKNIVTLAEVEKALNYRSVTAIPNDFRRVSESVNLGIPLHDSAPKAAATRAILELARRLCDAPAKKPGLFGRLFAQ